MSVKSAAKQRQLFEDQEVFTPAEIGQRLKATTRQARRWIDEQKIDPEGVIELPRGRLVYGWALNAFIAERKKGGMSEMRQKKRRPALSAGRQNNQGAVENSARESTGGADGPRRLRFRDPVHGGTGRVDADPRSARVLIVHEQNGGYSRAQLAALAEHVEAPSLGEFLSEPFRWLAPYAAGPGRRRAEAVPLPTLDDVEGWHRRLARCWAAFGYLTETRGITPSVLRAELVGWDGRRLTFPMFQGNELVAYKTRLPKAGVQMIAVAGSGRPWPLYPELDRRRGWALIVAGELDALRARSAGLPASSVTLGAGHWREEWTEELRGLRVRVCFDNNEEEQARERVRALRAAGIDARRLDLRRLGLDTPKGDLSDYLNGGGSARDLRAALRRRGARRSA